MPHLGPVLRRSGEPTRPSSKGWVAASDFAVRGGVNGWAEWIRVSAGYGLPVLCEEQMLESKAAGSGRVSRK